LLLPPFQITAVSLFDSFILKSWQFNSQAKGPSSASLLHYG
jgi:hypothetical protein